MTDRRPDGPDDAGRRVGDLDPSDASSRRRRWRRVVGTVGVAGARVRGRLLGGRPGRTLFSVLGVAVAVALMTTVTGVALGLTTGSTVHGEGVDYWIVPADNTADSALVDPGEAGLGEVHATAARLNDDDRIEYATPVQLQVLRVRNAATGTAEYVLAVGVIPPEDGRRVAGVPTGALSTDYPHHAGGSYDGEWTGEAVATDAAADLLALESGSALAVETGDSGRSFTVVDVADGGVDTGVGQVPVVVVHLAELQTVTDTTEHDQADQILVATDDPDVASTLADVYPGTEVVSRSGLAGGGVRPDDASLAVGLAAFVVAIAIGTLFVATTMGLEVTADRRRLATLASVGVSGPSRGLLVATETVVVAAVGGVAGVALGWVGIAAVNRLGAAVAGVGPLATFSPWLLAYGVGVAVLVGVLASPYPVWLSRRSGDATEALR